MRDLVEHLKFFALKLLFNFFERLPDHSLTYTSKSLKTKNKYALLIKLSPH